MANLHAGPGAHTNGGVTPRRLMRTVAAAQHGLFTADQARSRGLGSNALQNWRRTGEIEHRGGRVWAIRGASIDAPQTAMAFLLRHDPDGALAVDSAAAIWGLQGFTLLPAHVIRLRAGNKRPGAGRHTSTRYDEGHVTIVDGLRVTTAGRMLFDFAGRRHPARVERLVDTCLSRRLTTIHDLVKLLNDLQGRGRPGITLMRTLLEARGDPRFQPTDSNLERRFETILEEAGIGGFERQVVVGDVTGVIGRVDFARRHPAVIVEIQSELYHRSLLDQGRDTERIARLRAEGWIVVEIQEFDVWHRRTAVVGAIHGALLMANARP